MVAMLRVHARGSTWGRCRARCEATEAECGDDGEPSGDVAWGPSGRQDAWGKSVRRRELRGGKSCGAIAKQLLKCAGGASARLAAGEFETALECAACEGAGAPKCR